MKMFKDRLWQGNRAESKRNQLGQIIEWRREVWGMDRNGKPKDLPIYILNSRYLTKYSKFDNFYERTEKKYKPKHIDVLHQLMGRLSKYRWVNRTLRNKKDFWTRSLDRNMEPSWKGTSSRKISLMKELRKWILWSTWMKKSKVIPMK